MDEIRTVVGHKGEFVFDGPLRQRAIGRAAQAEVADVRCVEARGPSQLHERLMQALVNQESHAFASRLLNWKTFLPRGFIPCHGRRPGRPRRGNARMYNGAMATFSGSSAG